MSKLKDALAYVLGQIEVLDGLGREIASTQSNLAAVKAKEAEAQAQFSELRDRYDGVIKEKLQRIETLNGEIEAKEAEAQRVRAGLSSVIKERDDVLQNHNNILASIESLKTWIKKGGAVA
jgi:chromosome segregation ATPase